MRGPRRDHYIAPRAGPDSRQALDAAVASLMAARDFDDGDPAATVHVLASLALQLDGRLALAVAEARCWGCSWAEVADLLGVTRASAWQRYADKQTNDSNEGSR